MRLLFLLCAFTVGAFCQPFSFGVKAGVPLNDFLSAAENQNVSYVTATNRYIGGVTAELHLPFGLGVEVDALYRHLNYQENSNLERVHHLNHREAVFPQQRKLEVAGSRVRDGEIRLPDG